MKSFKGITGQDGARNKIKSRVSEQVACFESCLAWDHHYLPWCTSAAVIKLPSEKRLHSDYNSIPTSRAAKDPLLPLASMQTHKQKSQTGFICCAAAAQSRVGDSIANRQGYMELQDNAQVCWLIQTCRCPESMQFCCLKGVYVHTL